MIQSLLPLYNPWWVDTEWRIKGIHRELFEKLFPATQTLGYITVLKGARQCGKTFLVKQCISALLDDGVQPQNIFYFLMDDRELAHYVEENPTAFANFLRNEAATRKTLFVFFDEFQKVRGITELVKLFYESNSAIKFILTGSSSLQIAEKISESLLGRTETFTLYPFSFREFLSISAPDWPFSFSLESAAIPVQNFLKAPVDSFSELKDHYTKFHFAYRHFSSRLLPRYLLTGGYPQAALAATGEQAFLRLKEIKQAFIEKDIVTLLRIEKLREFELCMRALALQSGNLLHYNDLQSTIGVNFQTLKKFLNILEATYLWAQLPVFSTNKITSIKKRPKAYFHDVGMRNFMASTFDETQLEKEKGSNAENFAYMQLQKYNQYSLHGLANLHYWRSPDGNEIDFIFERGRNVLPIEIKFQKTAQLKIQRGFRFFVDKLQMKQAIVISDDLLEKREIGDCRVFIIPLVLLGMI